MECTDNCENPVPLVGRYSPPAIYKRNVHAWKTSKRYIFLRENVHHIDFEYSDGAQSSLLWFDLAWLCTKASPAARCGNRPVRQHRGGIEGDQRGVKIQTKALSLHWSAQGEFIAVSGRDKEAGRRGGRMEGRGWLRGSEVPVLSHRLAESVPVCLSVLTLSKSICPLWNCGQREGRGFQVGWLRRNSSKHNQDTRRTETTSTLRHVTQTQQSENLSEPLNFLR